MCPNSKVLQLQDKIELINYQKVLSDAKASEYEKFLQELVEFDQNEYVKGRIE